MATKTNGKVTNRIAAALKNGEAEGRHLVISPPNFKTAQFLIVGNTPYCQHKFPEKAKNMMMAKMRAGGTAKKSTKKEPRDFDADYVAAMYQTNPPWKFGYIPAMAIKAAMVDACRLTDFQMKSSKQCFTVLEDGLDVETRKPLIRITKGSPMPFSEAMRVQLTCDVRVRPLWEPGWESMVRIRFDADKFTIEDCANLLMRAGMQVGIGEGRQQSKMCVGLGWGEFRIDGYK